MSGSAANSHPCSPPTTRDHHARAGSNEYTAHNRGYPIMVTYLHTNACIPDFNSFVFLMRNGDKQGCDPQQEYDQPTQNSAFMCPPVSAV